MNTCQHRNTTFSRDICPDPCGVMHTFCDDCGGMLENCWHTVTVHVDKNAPESTMRALAALATAARKDFGDPVNWTLEQAQAAQAELDELERTDPDVAAAAASYDRMVERVTGKSVVSNPSHPSGLRPFPAATPAERAAADELTRELDTVYAEPTAIDANGWPEWAARAIDGAVRELIEQAVAAERAAIHARYEAVARAEDECVKRWSQDFDQPDAPEDASYAMGRAHAAEQAAIHIRQVAAQ